MVRNFLCSITNTKLVYSTRTTSYLLAQKIEIDFGEMNQSTAIQYILREFFRCKNLKEYEELLADHNFFRTRQSSVVNLLHIKKYVRGEGGQVWMSNGSEIEVARRRKEELLIKLSGINIQ